MAARPAYTSPDIAKEMKRIYGQEAKILDIDMRHEAEVKRYVMKIESAHKDAARSKLTFK